MPKVFITSKIPNSGITLLKKKGFSVHKTDSEGPLSNTELMDIFSEYDAVLSSIVDKIDDSIIAKASSKLRIIANYAVGFDNIDVLAAQRKGIVVCNTPGVAGESVAEHTFALILSCLKRIVEADKYVRSGKFHRFDPNLYVAPQLWGKTIGIVGLGRIGTFVASIASGGFKMKILYFDLIRSEDFEMLTEAQFSPLGKLFRESDIVTIHTPLTPQTKHLVSRAEFMNMKNSAILINTARGPIVDENALIWALSEGEIAAAGLDVYEHEPQISHELKILPNVVLTPHIASATEECREEMARISAENIIAVFEGKNPFGLVKVS